ncbi:A/G-specific adenine glycosylase [Sneathiella sp.]|uniref:A/G-specific adenine glycosylase n=1 Tax=Sneathiella sp. TaxID=1964365 RepID=UPI00261826E9|nr:A/G-specific adenine glycosylase [Sneathiella sp.]MDF2365796.1 A/G-specific adenine glycosylase [Sneathiella sp.]
MIEQKPPQKSFSAAILNWYDRHARRLPWRSLPGEQPDPYHVWLSEIMLQQTTVVTVGPYFDKFLTLWPTVQDMAAAPLDDILTAWAGLGYYARARNLHKCAIAISEGYNGQFPSERDQLLALPGVGPYTAAAISAIAFNKSETVVDGNIERIISRLYRIDTPLPSAKTEITTYAAKLTPLRRAGDYAQALMDIGATICTPRSPNCGGCPVSDFCAAGTTGDMERFPVKAPKKVKPTRRAVVFWLERLDGFVLLCRREEKGLLGGMMEFPSTEWCEEEIGVEEAMNSLFSNGFQKWTDRPSEKELVRHTFTHFHLELRPVVVLIKGTDTSILPSGQWVRPEDFGSYALPTLMTKVLRAVVKGRG